MEYGPPVQVGSGFEQRLARVPADGRSSVSGILVSRREGRHIALGLLEDDLLQVFFPWTLNFGTLQDSPLLLRFMADDPRPEVINFRLGRRLISTGITCFKGRAFGTTGVHQSHSRNPDKLLLLAVPAELGHVLGQGHPPGGEVVITQPSPVSLSSKAARFCGA